MYQPSLRQNCWRLMSLTSKSRDEIRQNGILDLALLLTRSDKGVAEETFLENTAINSQVVPAVRGTLCFVSLKYKSTFLCLFPHSIPNIHSNYFFEMKPYPEFPFATLKAVHITINTHFHHSRIGSILILRRCPVLGGPFGGWDLTSGPSVSPCLSVKEASSTHACLN